MRHQPTFLLCLENSTQPILENSHIPLRGVRGLDSAMNTSKMPPGPVSQAFGILFIISGILSYAIAPRGPLGVFTVLSGTASPDVNSALLAAHNLAHDALFILSAAVGVVAALVLSAVYGKKGTAIGATFLILSVLVLFIEPAISRGLFGSSYGAVHTPWHIAAGVLQIIVGAASFALLRKLKM